MIWPRRLIVLSLFTALGASFAHAAPRWIDVDSASNWSISFNGGGSFPTGDFTADVGIQLGGAADYALTSLLDLGFDASAGKNSHPCDRTHGSGTRCKADDFSTIQVGAHAKWHFAESEARFDPYAQLGAGAYNVKEDWTDEAPATGMNIEGSTSTGFHLGGKAALGLFYKASEQIAVGIVTDYNYVGEDKNGPVGARSVQYFGIQAAVRYSSAPTK